MIYIVMLAKIRRMHIRDGMLFSEIGQRTGLSRYTVRRSLRRVDWIEPTYPEE